MGFVLVGMIWELATWIIAGSDKMLIMFGLGLIVCALTVHILNDWRSGVLLFLLWVLFEDLARKYLGNSMIVFFAKDALIGIAYISFYIAKRKRSVATFKFPFMVPLGIFFGLAVVQIFNTWSPNVLYGVLALKIDFFYVPLMFLGYALLERPEDLERFLVVNIAAGILIAGLGIAQSVVGGNFLTPDDIAPELYELTHTLRYSPVTHSASAVTSSVFVSSGRFSFYLILLWILAMGAQGYLLLARRPGAKYGFLGIGVVTVAVMITGTRTPFVFMLASAVMMSAAFLWGAPWRWGQGHRLVKALRRAFLVSAIGLFLMGTVFPIVLGDHWRFLSETLSLPGTEGSEWQVRGWDYPVQNLMKAFDHDRWVEGYGTGTASLGMQYVTRMIGGEGPQVAVENGYGNLLVEMGVLGPILWLFWVLALLYSGWKVVRQLRETVYFPLAFAIWWYAAVLLIMLVHFGLPAYQNYVNNAYLWLLIGVLYRLPKLAQMPQPVPVAQHARSLASWELATRRT